MKRILFREEQRFNQWWIYLILLIPIIVLVYANYQQVFLGKPFGDNPMSDTGLMITSFFMLLFIGFMLSIRLITEVGDEGVQYRFIPFHSKPKLVTWEEVKEIELIRYRPVREYGGWGSRIGKGGRAFNVKGNIGLKLHLKTGKHILFGTQEPSALARALQSLKIPFYNRLDQADMV